jgi:peptidoglycan hydrolase CwlO-like protein
MSNILWAQAAGLAAVIVSVCSFLYTVWKGSKAEKSLGISANIQTTFDAQLRLINELQQEVSSLRKQNTAQNAALAEAEKRIQHLERSLWEYTRKDVKS